MEIDERVASRYEQIDEDERLWSPGIGDLVRLRTWDIFDRHLAAPELRIADIGGGPGTHSAYLASKGHDVIMFDPIMRHVDAARARSTAQLNAPYRVELAEARELPLENNTIDVALMMGPLYHLTDPLDRQAALAETLRVVVPGGHIMAEIITRHAWLIEATVRNILAEPKIWQDFERNISTGLSQDPENPPVGCFFAYFHTPDELRKELTAAGFTDITLVAVEGFGRLLGDLDQRLAEPAGLLQALRLAETEPSMLGVSAHVIGWARKPLRERTNCRS